MVIKSVVKVTAPIFLHEFTVEVAGRKPARVIEAAWSSSARRTNIARTQPLPVQGLRKLKLARADMNAYGSRSPTLHAHRWLAPIASGGCGPVGCCHRGWP